MKKLDMIIKDCSECPYCSYDDMTAAFICTNDLGTVSRIIGCSMSIKNHYTQEEFPPIPEGCPLENFVEHDYTEEGLTDENCM